MSEANESKKTNVASPPDRLFTFLERLAKINKTLKAAGLSQESGYRLIGPLTENPRRRLVRIERHTTSKH
jgi:hypothetical protein